MAAQIWKVVGGIEKGGILVRVGQDLKSSQLEERLSTGALVREVALVGERLHYDKSTGDGPDAGWVSISLKEKALLVRHSDGDDIAAPPVAVNATASGSGTVEKCTAALPLLVCFYSGGNTATQGRRQLKPFLEAAASKGFEDALVLDNYPTAPHDTCTTWADYISSLVGQIDMEPAQQNRKLLVFAHSLGCHSARGLARALQSRVLKLYLVGCRPCHLSTYSDAFLVETWAELAAVSDEVLMQRMLIAWPNELVYHGTRGPAEKWRPWAKDLADLIRRQYGSQVMGTVLGDSKLGLSVEDLKVEAPIFAFASKQEPEAGETFEKMSSWKELTSGAFEIQQVEGDHFKCLQPSLFDVILNDMRAHC